MELREYLFKKRITNKEFAEKVNYDKSYIGDVANGKKKPGKKLAKAIEKATNGEVTVEELMSLKEINDKDY
jgi:transcriptional regulator with XRE-family HTH domain